MSAEPDTAASRERQRRQLVVLAGLVALFVVVAGLLSAGDARRHLRPLVVWSTGQTPLFVAAVAAVLLARPVWSWIDRPVRSSHLAIAAVCVAVVGAGVAGAQNASSGYPTGTPGGRSLATLTQQPPAGDMALAWPAFTGLRSVVPGAVIVPPSFSWQPYFDEIAEIRLLPDTYDATLDRTSPSFEQEWIYDLPISEDVNLVVVGRSEDYRVFYDDSIIALIAEPGT